MRLLFVAADRMELTGILSHATAEETMRLPLDWARRVRLGSHEALLAANGVGTERAGAAVDVAVKAFHPEAIVSTGFCGALDPRLAIADIVVGTCIDASTAGGSFRSASAFPCAGAAGGKSYSGIIRCQNHVVATAAEKKILFDAGAIAVEMEAASVALKAREQRLSFYCIRSVTDLACENMVNDFDAVLRSDGHFDTIKLLGKLLGNRRRLPELVRLRRRCVLASRALGDFIADCRF